MGIVDNCSLKVKCTYDCVLVLYNNKTDIKVQKGLLFYSQYLTVFITTKMEGKITPVQYISDVHCNCAILEK